MKETTKFVISSYENKQPFKRYFSNWIKDSNCWILIYNCLRVHGIEMNKRELVEIINGETLRMDIDVDIYELILNLQYLNSQMLSAKEMQNTLDAKLLDRFAQAVFPKEGLRTSSLPVANWKYLPPHFHDMAEVIRKGLREKSKMTDPIERAVASHMVLCESYVYGDNTPIMAMVAMMYELLIENLPFPEMPVDVEEYDRIMTAYLKEKNSEFLDMMERSLVNRIDAIFVLAQDM